MRDDDAQGFKVLYEGVEHDATARVLPNKRAEGCGKWDGEYLVRLRRIRGHRKK